MDFTDFDLLYSVKTPFYLGDQAKARSEAAAVDIDDEDQKSRRMLNFYLLRILTEQMDLQELKGKIESLVGENPQFVETVTEMLKKAQTKSMDEAFYNKKFSTLTSDLKGAETWDLLSLTYAAFLSSKWSDVFHLTMGTKNLELLYLRALAYLHINRTDLSQKTVEEMTTIDSEGGLTIMASTILSLSSSLDPSGPLQKLQELGDSIQYTPKLCNLMGLTLLKQGEKAKAIKVFKKGIEESRVDTAQQLSEDQISILTNYLKSVHGQEDEMKAPIMQILSKAKRNPYAQDIERAKKMFAEATA